MVRPKMAEVRDSIDVTSNREIQGNYHHLRTLRELIIREQYQSRKQLKLDSIFKPIAHESNPGSPPTPPPFSPNTVEAAPLPVSPLPSTSTALEEFIGFQ